MIGCCTTERQRSESHRIADAGAGLSASELEVDEGSRAARREAALARRARSGSLPARVPSIPLHNGMVPLAGVHLCVCTYV